MRKWIFLLVLTILWTRSVFSSMVDPSEFSKHTTFTTWQGIEPDKWATIWLIKRHLSPKAYFLLVPPDNPLPADAVAFDVPQSILKRGNRQSMYHHLKTANSMTSPVLDALDKVIYDIEVNIWEAPTEPRVQWIETLYRQLQLRYQRDQVPVDCYLQFFDAVAVLLVDANASIEKYHQNLALTTTCPGAPSETSSVVEQINHINLLREISLGKKIIFIDTREREEFDEVHLPGAYLLSLREVNKKTVAQFADADLIVPYCVKDFRAFEVAKAMKQHGAKRVATLSPNGLKGWLTAQLPVVKNEGEAVNAQAALIGCAMEPARCLQVRQNGNK